MNTREKIYLMVGAMFGALGAAEWIQPSQPSGKWAWLQRWATENLGPNGYAKLLLVVGGVWLAIWAIAWLGRWNGKRGEGR